MDGFASGFVRPFEVRPVTPSRIVVTGTAVLSALHHSLQYSSLAEIAQSFDFPLYLGESLRVASADRIGGDPFVSRHRYVV